MDQNLDNKYKEILWDLLANPADKGQIHRSALETLVQDNPQSGVLQVLFARANNTTDYRHAAAYFAPKALHKIIHDPESLAPVAYHHISRPGQENYFNIGTTTEIEARPADQYSDAPVAPEESLSTEVIGTQAQFSALAEAEQPEAPKLLEAEYEQPANENLNQTFENSPAEQTVAEQPQEAAEAPVAETTNAPADEQPAERNWWDEPVDTPVEETLPEQENNTEAELEQTPVADEQTAEEPPQRNWWDEPVDAPAEETEAKSAPAEKTKAEEVPVAAILPAPAEEAKVEQRQQEYIDPYDPYAGYPTIDYPQEDPYEVYIKEQQWEVEEPAEETKKVNEREQTQSLSSFDEYRTENVFHRQEYIEDDVYDEIVSIDEIGIESAGNKFAESEVPAHEMVSEEKPTVAAQPEAAPVEVQTEEKKEILSGHPSADRQMQQEVETVVPVQEAKEAEGIDDHTETRAQEDKLIFSNIVGADYLSINEKLDELNKEIMSAQPLPVTASLTTGSDEGPEPETVSKYNDDSMPYSFMWWLDKTRKEHAANTRPYVAGETKSATKPKPAPQPKKQGLPNRKGSADELQQQYYENIFSLTSVSGVGTPDAPEVEFDHSKKEDVIIERFIHTEPQIKPLSADKLDNENKAKRSAEDQDALVTETLARIYADQMLYHKAIATYKKLMLKFPEKKLYFAAQIEQLEKKIN